jgi:hypothetical protein
VGVRWSARMGHGSWAECAGARARVLAGPKWPNKIVKSQFWFFLFSRKQFDFLYKIYPTIFFCSVNSKFASGK